MGCVVPGCLGEFERAVFCEKHWRMLPRSTKTALRLAWTRALDDIALTQTPFPSPDAFFRAGGDVVCHKCERKYADHPTSVEAPFLHVLCDGSFVKL